MKLTAKSCPREISAEPFLYIDRSQVKDSGATLCFREWAGETKPREIRLMLNDYQLRLIADLIEKVAAAREQRAKWLRRLVVIALFLLAPSARADIFDALAVAGAAGDVVTTEVGLHRGYVEQNIQNRPLRIGMNVALTSTCLLAARHYEHQGRRGWAKVLKLVPFAVFGGAAIHNAIIMRQK